MENTTPTDPAFVSGMTFDDIERTYKIRYAELQDEHGIAAGMALPTDVGTTLAESYRRAHVRRVAERDGASTATLAPGERVTEDGTKVLDTDNLTCKACGDHKPAKKFPTVSGKPGMRETTCRDCKKRGK